MHCQGLQKKVFAISPGLRPVYPPKESLRCYETGFGKKRSADRSLLLRSSLHLKSGHLFPSLFLLRFAHLLCHLKGSEKMKRDRNWMKNGLKYKGQWYRWKTSPEFALNVHLEIERESIVAGVYSFCSFNDQKQLFHSTDLRLRPPFVIHSATRIRTLNNWWLVLPLDSKCLYLWAFSVLIRLSWN